MDCVIALAGRRIDAPGAPERFPAGNCGLVLGRIADCLRAASASALVASGACGADLLAHQAARTLGFRSRLVLPFEPPRFRELSVTDRPGGWGPVFDEVCARAAEMGDLIVLADAGTGSAAYAATNRALLEEAASLAAAATPPAALRAVTVWEGASRGDGDLTADFAAEARQRGFPVETVSTVAERRGPCPPT